MWNCRYVWTVHDCGNNVRELLFIYPVSQRKKKKFYLFLHTVKPVFIVLLPFRLMFLIMHLALKIFEHVVYSWLSATNQDGMENDTSILCFDQSSIECFSGCVKERVVMVKDNRTSLVSFPYTFGFPNFCNGVRS